MKRITMKKMVCSLSMLALIAMAGGVALQKDTVAADVVTNEDLILVGTSVRLDEPQVRFCFEGIESLEEGEIAGALVIPADLLTGDLTMETTAVSAVALKVEGNTGYAYLPAGSIPATQYNRRLAFRGYVQDSEGNYTYTETAYASMAYVAWKYAVSAEYDENYAERVASYRGNYTLTYGTNGEIPDLCYGASLDGKLPSTVDGVAVDSWYWDEGLTDAIEEGDYATGSYAIYYKARTYDVSGNVKMGADGVPADIYVGDAKVGTAAVDGAYSLEGVVGGSVLTFKYRDGAHVYGGTTTVTEAGTLDDVVLSDITYKFGSYEGKTSATAGLTADDELDGQFTYTGATATMWMPNTATSESYVYEITTSQYSDYPNDEVDFGIAITNGEYSLLFPAWRWGYVTPIITSADSGDFTLGAAYLSGHGAGAAGATHRIERTADTIKWYLQGVLKMTIHSNGAVETTMGYAWEGDTFTSATEELAALFTDNEHVMGFASSKPNSKTVSVTNIDISYRYFREVTGTVYGTDGTTPAEGINVLLNGDIVATTGANGQYTVTLATGDNTLVFDDPDSGLGCTKTVTVTKESTTLAAVTLVDSTYEFGTHGTVTSADSSAWEKTETLGTWTLQSTLPQNSQWVMPNTATTEDYTYKVQLQGRLISDAAGGFGVLISNGEHTLAITSSQWSVFHVVVDGNSVVQLAGAPTNMDWWPWIQVEKTSTSIKVTARASDGVNSADILTINSDGSITTSLTYEAGTNSASAQDIAKTFFGAGVEHAVGFQTLTFGGFAQNSQTVVDNTPTLCAFTYTRN